jgi:hypothetical protein
VFGRSSGGYGAITHALRHSDIWSAAACHSGDMGFGLCYLPDMPAVLRALAGAENSIEKWWQQLEAARKHPEGSFKVINALAMAASYDPDPTQFLGIRLPVTFDTCEVIEERRANWLRQDPVVAIETQGEKSPQAEGALHRQGSVQSALRCPQVRAAANRAWHCASLRGVSRQPYQCRLSDGRELAFSCRGAVRLTQDAATPFPEDHSPWLEPNLEPNSPNIQTDRQLAPPRSLGGAPQGDAGLRV